MKTFLDTVVRLTAYNVKIIFGNKFVYFIVSAFVLYFATAAIRLFSNSEFTDATAYSTLLLPSLLTIFYPMCFGIQNDQDAKIIEIIFGIPNYRYKVWLVRLLIAYVICFAVTLALAFLTDWLLVETPAWKQTVEVMVPALLIGTLSFMFSTIVRNGSGTAVVVVIFCLLFFIFSGSELEASRWNVFLNPFEVPQATNPVIYANTVTDNRIILPAASFLFLLIGLYKTQDRGKFI